MPAVHDSVLDMIGGTPIVRLRNLSPPGGVVLPQFENPGNPDYHQATTAEEIWQQTEGRLAAVVVAAGTGGSFTGVARLIKERAPAAQRVLVEPVGSIFGGGAPAPHVV